MHSSLRSPSLRRSTTRCLPGLALAALAFSASPSAQAHITLMNPPSWVVEQELGNPQKAGPCGDDGTTAVVKTNTVTQFTAGQTITVMWKETVAHDGHFRISLTKPGADRSTLVDPPVVTANGDGTSGLSISATTVENGTGNVLMDNLFPRENVTAPAAEPFMQDITLPNEPCEKCTLQVIQFMAKHTPGYFYHHCADIEIVAKDNAGAAGSGAVGAAGSASMGTGGSSSTGAGGSGAGTSTAGSSSMSGADEDDDGGCTLAGGAAGSTRSGAAAIALFGLAATLWRRRAAR